MGRYVTVGHDEFDRIHSVTLPSWERVDSRLTRTLAVESFGAAAELALQIARIADELDHHPDIDIRFPGKVLVTTTTHETGGLTTLDLELARRISELRTNKT